MDLELWLAATPQERLRGVTQLIEEMRRLQGDRELPSGQSKAPFRHERTRPRPRGARPELELAPDVGDDQVRLSTARR